MIKLAANPQDILQLVNTLSGNISPEVPYYGIVAGAAYLIWQGKRIKSLESDTTIVLDKIKAFDTEFEVFKDKILPRLNNLPSNEKEIFENYIEKVNRIKGKDLK